MGCDTKAGKTYRRRLWISMAAYVVILFSVSWLFRHAPPAGPIKYLLAALPALPIVGVVAIMGFYLVEESDEFTRMKAVQAMLWGLGATLAVTTVWGFIENYAGAPHVPAFMVFPLFCAGMGVGQCVNRWRYR